MPTPGNHFSTCSFKLVVDCGRTWHVTVQLTTENKSWVRHCVHVVMCTATWPHTTSIPPSSPVAASLQAERTAVSCSRWRRGSACASTPPPYPAASLERSDSTRPAQQSCTAAWAASWHCRLRSWSRTQGGWGRRRWMHPSSGPARISQDSATSDDWVDCDGGGPRALNRIFSAAPTMLR
jgi:hypothetical protein